MENEYTVTIGLEVHAELSTKTKAYCSCKIGYGDEPNTNICPVCMGLPGALPHFNEEVLNYAMKAGVATNCDIITESKFDRKNYFYPDLSKGYQITQSDKPVASDGYLEIESEDGTKKKIGIERIHMEEDTAKVTHDPFGRGTLLDYNRCGVPLIEIVSKPDIHSAKDAIAYLEKLRKLLIFLDVADCKMEEGGFRADVNVSVSNTDKLGNRSEIKNMNSFKSIERAIEYETKRQIENLKQGKENSQNTLRWDDIEGETSIMRTKENANDYRYFPEADLPKFEVSEERYDNIAENIPELEDAKKERYINDFGLSNKQIIFVLSNMEYIRLFEEANDIISKPKEIANVLMSDVAAYVNENIINPIDLKVTAETIAKYVSLLENGKLNSKTGKKVLKEMLENGGDPETIMKEKGLIQITDEKQIKEMVEKVISNNPESVQDILAGKDRAVKFLVGQVMKESRGKANPEIVNKEIIDQIEKMK